MTNRVGCVDAMLRKLQQEKSDDFIIAAGKANSLEGFVRCAFDFLGLNWRDHVIFNSVLFRPTDLFWSQGCSCSAETVLGWRASSGMKDIIRMMVEENANHLHKEHT
jgi:GDPmannose 4,6-dehydratase